MSKKKSFQKSIGNRKHISKNGFTCDQLGENIDRLLLLCTSPQISNLNKLLENHISILGVIDKIKSFQSKYANDVTNNKRNSSDKIDAFFEWLKLSGAKFEKCSIAEFPGFDLGLRAEENISFGSLFITIPQKLMFTNEDNQFLLKNFMEKDHILRNMPNVALAIKLLFEKFEKKSFFKPYVDVLPEMYSTVFFFTQQELQELKGSPTLEEALMQIRNIGRQYAYFHTIFSNGDDPLCRLMRPHFTYDMYCWAVSTVMTRQNMIPSEDGTTMVNALIPLWDFCNHENGDISTNYNTELKRSECLAHRDFRAGEQVFIFYGPRTNAEFFIHNGFVPEENPYDYYSLKLGISKSDPYQGKREQLLHKLFLKNSNEFHLKLGACKFGLDAKLLAFIRIFSMNEGQLTHWLDNNEVNVLEHLDCPLDEELQRKSYIFLQTRLKLLQASYDTTFEEDFSLLNAKKLSTNATLAVKMRMSEKKIIAETIALLEQHIR